MAVLPFRLQGRTRIEQLRGSIQTALQEWLPGWSSDGALGAVMVEDAGSATPQGEWWDCQDGRALVCVPPGGLAALGHLVACVPDGSATDFAAAIGRRALADMMARVLLQAWVEMDRTDACNVTDLQGRHGAAGFRLSLGALPIALHLSQEACDALAPRVPPRAVPLGSRREALLASPMRLQATIDLGGADINAATALRPGEVIKTGAIADSIVSVRADDGTVLFRGVLESIDGHKALRCTSVELTQGNK